MVMQTFKRDVATLWRSLVLGETPPYLVTRGETKRYTSAVKPRPLRVVSVERSELDVTVWLANPGAAPFEPGQFLTLEVTVEGKKLRRAYSISSDPASPDQLRLTIRRVTGGVVSNHLHKTLAPEQVLRVLGPSGRFVWTADGSTAPLLLVGGGSGLTPLMAILYAALERSRQPIHLVYANRTAQSGLYGDELGDLVGKHGDRLTVTPVVGDLTAEHLTGAKLAPQELEAYVCGPDGLMDLATDTLAGQGVGPGRIHTERFHSPAAANEVVVTRPQPATFQHAGRVIETTVRSGETLLEAGLRAGADLPFSCAMGGCGACRMKLHTGTVMMAEPHCLTAEERAAGMVLTCVAKPTGPCTVSNA